MYRPRFELDPRVIRIPIVPGSDPRKAYGDLFRWGGVRGGEVPVSSCLGGVG